MAEFVQQRIEEMIPEMEEMERVGLFTNNETGKILKRRRAFEYKLRKLQKSLNDYILYIQYEQNVLSLVKQRRRQKGYRFKRFEIDVAIVQRIHKLFGQATKRFPEDLQLWLSHIDFAKKRKETSTVSRIISKMLRTHNHKPELWILAAKYEFEENSDPEVARKFFHRGLRFNQESQHLWLEYYRMELMYCDKSRKRLQVLGVHEEHKKKNETLVLNGEIALVVFRKAQESIPDDVSFLLEFVPICRLFDFTEKQEDEIFSLILDKYTNNELVWDAVARRQFCQATEGKGGSGIFSDIFQNSFDTYEKAVQQIPTITIFTLYLDFLSERLKEHSSDKKATDIIIQQTLSVFETASEKKLLSAVMFLKWQDLLTDLGLICKALEVADLATREFPTDVNVWHKFLDLQILNDNINLDAVFKTFENSIKNVPLKESWPLWNLILDFSQKSNSERIESIYEKGFLQSDSQIVMKIKSKYLEWHYLTHGISQARSIYKRFSSLRPISLSFFKEYIQMEKSQTDVNINNLRKVYTDAVEEYGKNNPDLWIQFIHLESTHPEGKMDSIPSIHFKATKTLQEEAIDEFILKYTLYRTGQLKV